LEQAHIGTLQPSISGILKSSNNHAAMLSRKQAAGLFLTAATLQRENFARQVAAAPRWRMMLDRAGGLP
jgi:hypothetical protein